MGIVKTKKYNKVRAIYPKMRVDTFNKFYLKDWTETKKYFEYMVKMWDGNRKVKGIYYDTSINDFVTTVKEFDEYLPYIAEKDIYNKKYQTYTELFDVVQNAKIRKATSEFKKEEHVNVVYECDSFLMVEPKTHLGSLKYGAGTRWCTASRNNEYTFNRYKDRGTLVYVISKNKDNKSKNYDKLALFMENNSSFNGRYEIYNANDGAATENGMLNNGWNFYDLFVIDLHLRQFFHKKRRLSVSKKYVNTVTSKLTTIDFERLLNEIEYIEKTEKNEEAFKDTKSIIDKFVNDLKKYK